MTLNDLLVLAEKKNIPFDKQLVINTTLEGQAIELRLLEPFTENTNTVALEARL